MAGTALITGGVGGLGGAVTAAFIGAGWRVVVPVLPELLEKASAPGAELIAADLTDVASVAEVVALAAGDSARPLSAVVNLVGGFAAGGRVHETPIEAFEAQLTLNLRPTYLVTAAGLPHLLAAGGGSVVCVSSRAAEQPFSGAAGYITGKAAVSAFVDALNAEYRQDNIRVNAVLPSVIDTPANRAAMPDADWTRWVPPAQIAAVILNLCGDESHAVTGTKVRVYGRA
ncbi:MAG TPA: SDR family NAD(P)-dependent oxidoreductase [Sporichthyaceae bacterium]|nr:SDR family NAD(P)-dependent oxidoreductase [Sporichthyaceae bacterium]